MGEERLKDLGLLHLQHDPRALAAALRRMGRVFDERRKAAAKRRAHCRANGHRKAG